MIKEYSERYRDKVYLQNISLNLRSLNTRIFIIYIFFAFLLMKSLVPATKGTFIPFPLGFYIWWSDLLLLLLCLLVVFHSLFNDCKYLQPFKTTRWYFMLIMFFGIYQIFSILWNEKSSIERGYSILQSSLMLSSVFISVLLFSGLIYSRRLKFISYLVVILAFVLSVYICLSFILPEVRPSFSYMDRTLKELGYIRVFGPLAPSTTINIILFPLLGFTIGMIFLPNKSRLFWSTLTIIYIISIIGTGSRGAVISGGIFCMLTLLSLRFIKTIKLFFPLVLIFLILIIIKDIPDRFKNFEDNLRIETYKTAINVFTDNYNNLIFGVGHGGMYSLLHDNTIRKLKGKDRWFLQTKETKYGFTLTNSHSTFLQTLVETGIIGFVALSSSLFLVIINFFKYYRLKDPWNNQARLTLSGCISSMALMGTDVFFYNVQWLVLIWTALMIFSVETIFENVYTNKP